MKIITSAYRVASPRTAGSVKGMISPLPDRLGRAQLPMVAAESSELLTSPMISVFNVCRRLLTPLRLELGRRPRDIPDSSGRQQQSHEGAGEPSASFVSIIGHIAERPDKDYRLMPGHGPPYLRIGEDRHRVFDRKTLAVDARCTSSRTPARDPGNAHRGQWATDDGFGGGDEAVRARDLKPLAEFQANAVDNYRQ
jgi:hypothetical protein